MKGGRRKMRRFQTRFDLPTDDYSVPDMNLLDLEEVPLASGLKTAASYDVPAPSVEPVKSVKPVKPIDSVKSVGPVEPVKPVDTVELEEMPLTVVERRNLGALAHLMKISDMYIVSDLGSGGFGSVFKCVDKRLNSIVAVKYFHLSTHWKTDFDREVNTMLKISEKGVTGFVEMIRSMERNGVCCIIYELLGMSLNDYLEKQDVGLPLTAVQKLISQILKALKQLHRIGIVHADLKPENIAFVGDPSSLQIKVLDLGSSLDVGKNQQWEEHQTRYYRSPEACLKVKIGTASDMWSLGCILGELVTCDVIFPGESNEYQLQLYCILFGPPPNYLLRKSRKTKDFFNYIPGDDDFSFLQKPFFKSDYNLSYFKKRLPTLDTILKFTALREDSEKHLHKDYMELLRRLLQMDPETRITAAEAWETSFIKRQNEADNAAKQF